MEWAASGTVRSARSLDLTFDPPEQELGPESKRHARFARRVVRDAYAAKAIAGPYSFAVTGHDIAGDDDRQALTITFSPTA